LVADRVPEGVVDSLERVQVQQQYRQLPAGAIVAGHGVLEPIVEQCPVRQVGQWVVEGMVAQLLGKTLALGDVGGDADHPDQVAARRPQRRGRQLHVDGTAVAAMLAQLQPGGGLPRATGGGDLDGRPARLRAGRMRPSQDLLAAPAVDAFGGRVPQLHPLVPVQFDDRDRRGVDDGAEPLQQARPLRVGGDLTGEAAHPEQGESKQHRRRRRDHRHLGRRPPDALQEKHRRGHQRGSGEHGQPQPRQPRRSSRLARLGQLPHRGVQRGCAPTDVGRQPARVEEFPGLVCPVQLLQCVPAIRDQQAEEHVALPSSCSRAPGIGRSLADLSQFPRVAGASSAPGPGWTA